MKKKKNLGKAEMFLAIRGFCFIESTFTFSFFRLDKRFLFWYI